jgi:TRAP-type C4-dicarboxylate transport system permease large subunit
MGLRRFVDAGGAARTGLRHADLADPLDLEIDFPTPSVGLNPIVAMLAFKQPFGLLVGATVPYVVLMLSSLVLVVWPPWIAMGLVDGQRP